MPKATYTGEEVDRFELLKPGDYTFEIISYEAGLSKGANTTGCEQIALKHKLFANATMASPVAILTNTLIFPQSGKPNTDRFLSANLNMFAKSTGLAASVGVGEEIEYSEAACVGLRGWLRLKQTKSEKTGELRNEVDFYRTDKGRISKVVKVAPPTQAGEEEAWNV